MKYYFIAVLVLLVLTTAASAYAHEGESGETEMEMHAEGTGSVQAQQGRVILESDTNVSTGIEHEDIGIQGEEEKDTETKESGEKAGTEDINIGVGEMQEAQHNESDLNFTSRLESSVSVQAVEVRGWDPEKKVEFLQTVKTHAQVQSGQDLEHFAQGVLLQHDNVDSIETSSSSVAVHTRVPAKLLGIFDTTINQETTITFGDGEHGRVKVKFPWMRFLYQINARYQQNEVEQTLLPEINDEVLVAFEQGAEASVAIHAAVIERLVDFFSNE